MALNSEARYPSVNVQPGAVIEVYSIRVALVSRIQGTSRKAAGICIESSPLGSLGLIVNVGPGDTSFDSCSQTDDPNRNFVTTRKNKEPLFVGSGGDKLDHVAW